MRLSEAVIDSTVWDEVEVLRGTGGDLAESLRRFVNASSPAEMPDLWDDLEGVAFTQNTLHDGAVPVVDVMLAVLADPSPHGSAPGPSRSFGSSGWVAPPPTPTCARSAWSEQQPTAGCWQLKPTGRTTPTFVTQPSRCWM